MTAIRSGNGKHMPDTPPKSPPQIDIEKEMNGVVRRIGGEVVSDLLPTNPSELGANAIKCFKNANDDFNGPRVPPNRVSIVRVVSEVHFAYRLYYSDRCNWSRQPD